MCLQKEASETDDPYFPLVPHLLSLPIFDLKKTQNALHISEMLCLIFFSFACLELTSFKKFIPDPTSISTVSGQGIQWQTRLQDTSKL